MGNISSLPASATQSQGQVERLKFVSEEQKVAARLAPMLANNVDIACILKGIERCLPFLISTTFARWKVSQSLLRN